MEDKTILWLLKKKMVSNNILVNGLRPLKGLSEVAIEIDLWLKYLIVCLSKNDNL